MIEIILDLGNKLKSSYKVTAKESMHLATYSTRQPGPNQASRYQIANARPC
jgi:hypothetical protein